jgi:hypothetical protein
MRVDDSVLIHRITHSMDANIFRLEKVGRKVKLKTQQRMVGTTIQSNCRDAFGESGEGGETTFGGYEED